jgi:hypothetical protein
VCLAPALVSLYVGLPAHAPPGPGAPWNAGVFFAAIALSRIGQCQLLRSVARAAHADALPGLWSFDLIQLQMLQEALRAHPRRSRLAGLQLSLQAAFDLAKYALVLALNRWMPRRPSAPAASLRGDQAKLTRRAQAGTVPVDGARVIRGCRSRGRAVHRVLMAHARACPALDMAAAGIEGGAPGGTA